MSHDTSITSGSRMRQLTRRLAAKLALCVIVLSAGRPALGIVQPDSGEANTEAVTLPDQMIRAPGRPKGFLFLNYHNNESVSVFAGGLSVHHPSSPVFPLQGGGSLALSRAYSSKSVRLDIYKTLWHLPCPDGDHPCNYYPVYKTEGIQRGISWAGLGWSVHLGRIADISEKETPGQGCYSTIRYFVEPDGTHHRLYNIADGQWGTGDGSYIRAERQQNGYYKVLYPDGRWLLLEQIVGRDMLSFGTCSLVGNPDRNGWYTVAAGRGSFTHYTVAYYRGRGFNHREAIERITDSSGRTISFDIYTDQDPEDPEIRGMLKAIRAPASAGSEAAYTFRHQIFQYNPGASTEKLPLLQQVELPEGYTIRYEYTGDPSPLLRRIVYPTGGFSEYSYQGYTYKRWDTLSRNCYVRLGRREEICYEEEKGIGVVQRRVWDGQGRSFSWAYGRSWVYDPPNQRFWQWFVQIDPYGNATRYLHYGEPADTSLNPLYGRVREVFTYKGGVGSELLRHEVIDQQVMCSSHRLVKSYDPSHPMREADVRVVKQVTEFFEPGASTPAADLVVDYLDWNGLGRFYRTRFSGTALQGPPRETTTWWEPDTARWMLHKHAGRDTVAGAARARTTARFDLEGRLLEHRTFRTIEGLGSASAGFSNIVRPVACDEDDPPPYCRPRPGGSPPGGGGGTCSFCSCPKPYPAPVREPEPAPDPSQDQIMTYAYDPATGDLVTRGVRFEMDDAATTADDPLLVSYQYQNGAIQRVRVEGVGYDQGVASIEPWGIPSSISDASGSLTEYQHDAQGRLTEVRPSSDSMEASTRHVYAPGGAAEHFMISTRGGAGTGDFEPSSRDQVYAKEIYDGLGRTRRVERALPGGALAVQEIAYAPAGEVVFVSEWIPATTLGTLARRSFVRPGSVRDPWWIDVPLHPATNRPWGTVTFYGDTDPVQPDNPLAVGWDPLRRVHQVVAADGATTRTTYGALTRTVTISGVKLLTPISGLGDPGRSDIVTTYWEDGEGRLLMVDVQDGSADAIYQYDLLDRLVKVNLIPQLPADPWAGYATAPEGQVRTRLYDGVGRLVEAYDPESGLTRNALFNVQGQILQRQDARGRSRGYHFETSYDILGRPLRTERAADAGVAAGTVLSESFDRSIPAGWQVSTGGTWHWYRPAEGCGASLEAADMGYLRVGSTSGGQCGYASGPQGRDELISPILGADGASVHTIPIGGMTVLSFSYFLDVRDTSADATATRLDRSYLEVEDLTAGGARTRVFYADSEIASARRWRRSPEIDLSEFKHHRIRLRFVFERTDAGESQRAGWAIDDVRVIAKQRETLVEREYDQSLCGAAGASPDLCSGGESPVERALGKLSTMRSYQDGSLTSAQRYVYKGLNGRVSSWEQQIDSGSGASLDSFVTRVRYNALGLVEGMRAPQRSGEAAREYRPAYDRGYAVGLGDDGHPARYIADVKYNAGGGIRQLRLASGAVESIAFDERYRPQRITVQALPPGPSAARGSGGSGGGMVEITTVSGGESSWRPSLVVMAPRRFPGASSLPLAFDTGAYQYDGAGNIIGMGSDLFIYDAGLRLRGALVQGREISYGYDLYGNMTDRHMPLEYPPIDAMEFSGRSYAGASGTDNRIHDPGFAYDENGNLIAEPADGMEPARRYVFDATNRLEEVWAYSSAGFIPVGRYVYDADGQRVGKEDNMQAGRLTHYVRDRAGQVLAEYVAGADPAASSYRSKEYLYGLGRLLGVNAFCGPPPSLAVDVPSSAGGMYRFIAGVPAGLVGATGFQLEVTTSTERKILEVSPSSIGSFEVAHGELSTTEPSYLRLRARASCGETVWSPVVAFSPGQGGPTPATGAPQMDLDRASVRYFHVDHLGSVRAETDAAAVSTARRDYYPFGREVVAQSGPSNLRFTGQERDPESGLDYMLARSYDPAFARFGRPDDSRKGASPFDPQSWNRYTYALNNPHSYIDPDGLYARYIHNGYSFHAAIRAGRGYFEAHEIGAGAASVDSGWTSPFNPLPMIGPKIRRDFHAFWGKIPDEERRDKRTRIAEEVRKNNGNPWMEGRSLHPLGDSFSHEGYGPFWGHFWNGVGPDRTSKDPAKAVDMFRATEEALRGQCFNAYGCDETSFLMALAKYNGTIADTCPPATSCQHSLTIQVETYADAVGLARELASQGRCVAIDGVLSFGC